MEYINEQQESLYREKLIEKMLEFFETYDFLQNTQHKKTLELLYCSDRKYTDDEISNSVFICKRTLYRYKKMYKNLENEIRGSILQEIRENEKKTENKNIEDNLDIKKEI